MIPHPRQALWIAVAVIGLAGCASSRTADKGSTATPARDVVSPLQYTVDLTTPSDDAFEVTLSVDNLGPDNAIYQFAATAPGTYEVADMGRYVKSFSAMDGAGNEIPVEKVSTNQWRISRPDAVRTIEYSIAETWDTPVDGAPVMMMGGTSIETDHVLINGHGVLGYPTGMQARPIRLTLNRPEDWMIGTALSKDANGRYLADNFDHIVDSPILLGRLTKASLDVRGSKVEIFTYSMTGKVTSEMVLDATRDILNAAGDFLKGLPVDRYTFLFHFGHPLGEYANDTGYVGALEHSYSSEYVLDEATFEHDLTGQIPSFVAHEFFHVVTPLNIHSEVIEQFNFVTPVASEHLWLYEGTTEWVAQTMQLRGGLITLDEYLDRMSKKLIVNDTFDPSVSLSELSLQSYTEKGQQEYPNIYERGAVVAALLDLRLLELSGGKKGLREVLLELAEQYGPERAFKDATFFDTFTEMTFPEIRSFFDDYVRDTKPLPVAEYFGKVGVHYAAQVETGQMVPMLGLQLGLPNGQITVMGTTDATAACGFAVGDVITEINGQTLDFTSAQALFTELGQLGAGIPYSMTVQRSGKDRAVTCEKELSEYVAQHVFVIDPSPSESQRELRGVWTRNLD